MGRSHHRYPRSTACEPADSVGENIKATETRDNLTHQTCASLRLEISAGSAVKLCLMKSDCFILRDVPMTVAPASRNDWVTYFPNPLSAPVTNAALLSIDTFILIGMRFRSMPKVARARNYHDCRTRVVTLPAAKRLTEGK